MKFKTASIKLLYKSIQKKLVSAQDSERFDIDSGKLLYNSTILEHTSWPNSQTYVSFIPSSSSSSGLQMERASHSLTQLSTPPRKTSMEVKIVHNLGTCLGQTIFNDDNRATLPCLGQIQTLLRTLTRVKIIYSETSLKRTPRDLSKRPLEGVR